LRTKAEISELLDQFGFLRQIIPGVAPTSIIEAMHTAGPYYEANNAVKYNR
jgi:hypothetical protein